MPLVIPIVNTTLGTTPELLAQVTTGLESGVYERIGGVVRRADNGQIVTWLRNVDGRQFDPSIGGPWGPLAQLTAATSLLNLSVSAIGFAFVMRRLGVIEAELTAVAKTIESASRKLDLGFYANFRAALQLARDAFDMHDAENRRTSAALAINRFLEAEHHYLGLLDTELDSAGWAVPQIFNTLILAYVSAACCYLELDEIDSALRHLEEGSQAIGPRMRRYYAAIIGAKPEVYLHPRLSRSISLERLTWLMRYQEPGLTTAQVFEKLREPIWKTASRYPELWFRELPPVIWNHIVDGVTRKGPFVLALGSDVALAKLMPRLSEAFGHVERAYETCRCMQGFQIELQHLLETGISFHDWQQRPMSTPPPSDPLVWLLPQGSEIKLTIANSANLC